MTTQNALKDQNNYWTLIGESTSVAGETARAKVDPSNGALQVAVVSGGGSAGADIHIEDAVAASGDSGSFVLGVRNDAAAATTSANGDYSQISTDSAGRVGISDLGGSVTVDSTQLPSAMGQATMANSSPVVIASNQSAVPVSGSVTVSGTVGVSGTVTVDSEMTTTDYDTGAGTSNVAVVGILLPASGGPVNGGTATNPIRVDPTGTTAQPITDNAGSLTIDSPGVPTALGQSTMANSMRVTLASDQSSLAVTPSNAGNSNAATGGTATKSNVASSATSVTVLASNASRKWACVYNDSTQILYLDLSGGTASSSSYTVQIAAGGYYEVPQPVVTGAITGIWASANGNARVTEAA